MGVTCPAIVYTLQMAYDGFTVDADIFAFTEYLDASTGQLTVYKDQRSKGTAVYEMELHA